MSNSIYCEYYSGEKKLVSKYEEIENYDNVRFMNCHTSYNNNKNGMPKHLPKRLKILWCMSNRLLKLPELPETLEELLCNNNELMELPVLPKSLKKLDCSRNNLRILPEIPNDLKYLCCSNNDIIRLPELHDNIETLYVMDNEINNIEKLPEELIDFDCSHNKLISLPIIPSKVLYLYCNNNDLSDLDLSLCVSIKRVLIMSNRFNRFPISLFGCRELLHIIYRNNPIEMTMQEENFVNIIERRIRMIVERSQNRINGYMNDKQNIHNSNIQSSVRKSIYNLIHN